MLIEIKFIIVFLISLMLLLLFRPLAIKFNLVDYPTKRKNHVGNVPLIGGVCIFLAVLVSDFLIDFNNFSKMLLYISSLILLQGIWDDFVNLKAKTKMLFQALITWIMICATDVKLNSFGNSLGEAFPLELGLFSIPITIIAVVGLTNAINMIDGIDGYAASFVLIAIIGALYFAINKQNLSFVYFLLAIVSALIPFVFFNITPIAKIKVFLGDAGSLFLGFFVSWILIYSAENTISFSHGFALWCVTIPLFDFFTVIIIRILDNRSLFIANRDHVHHFLIQKGISKQLILILTVSWGLIFLLIGIVLENTFPKLSIPVFFVFFLFYLLIRINTFFTTNPKNEKKKLT